MSSFPSREWFESVVAAANDDHQFQRVSRAFDATIRFDFGTEAFALTVDDGEITDIHEDPTFVRWDFALRASEGSWRKALSETPPPLCHDLLASWLRGDMTLEGDLKVAIQHMRSLKQLMTVFREVGT